MKVETCLHCCGSKARANLQYGKVICNDFTHFALFITLVPQFSYSARETQSVIWFPFFRWNHCQFPPIRSLVCWLAPQGREQVLFSTKRWVKPVEHCISASVMTPQHSDDEYFLVVLIVIYVQPFQDMHSCCFKTRALFRPWSMPAFRRMASFTCVSPVPPSKTSLWVSGYMLLQN